MHISLIGMSGVGKSFWSKRFEQAGFKRFCCDDLIRARLAPQLTQSDGSKIRLGQWMGYPNEPQYKECEEIYLNTETQVLEEIIDYLAKASKDENIVVDTTGSLIYVNDSVIKGLKENTTFIHLETSPDVRKEMAKQYINRPVSVLWRDKFVMRPDESVEHALARCYQDLIASREIEYLRLADLSVPYEEHRNENFRVDSFLRFNL